MNEEIRPIYVTFVRDGKESFENPESYFGVLDSEEIVEKYLKEGDKIIKIEKGRAFTPLKI